MQGLAVGTALLFGVGIWRWRRQAVQPPICDAASIRRMTLIGHRGASAVCPENTLAAFRHALLHGAGFEMDISACETGEVIVLHDDTLRRTATLKPGVHRSTRGVLDTVMKELPLKTLQDFDVGSWMGEKWSGEEVPLFEQALSILVELGASPTAHTFAELKANDEGRIDSMYDARLPPAAAKAVHNKKVTPVQLTWISFSLSLAIEMKRLMPSYSCLLIGMASSERTAWAYAYKCVEAGLDGVDLNAGAHVSKELVQWLHARGKKVAVWVYRAPAINDTEEDWNAMAAAGVDFFTSNLPPAIYEWHRAACAG
jgi:glycerophosphoryl diester phosphodiesterase